jgi:trehalose synthase-fused probable maltokinase
MDDENELRERAYYLWEAAGCPDGQADEHWAQARKEAGLPDASDAEPSSHPLLEADELSQILSPANTDALEKNVLPRYLVQQRWFAAKDRTIDSLRIVTPATVIDQCGLLAQVEVKIGESIERYSMPLAIVWDERNADELELARKMAIARVRGEHGEGWLTDAFFVPEFVRTLIDKAMSNAGSIDTEDGGKLSFMTEPGAPDQSHADADIRWLSTEQSNSSVIVGGRIVMKLVRRLQAGTHPEAEMCRFLTRAGYRNSSPLLAEIVQTDPEGAARSMLILEGFIANDGDTWTHAIDCLRASSEQGGERLNQMSNVIGKRLGELHVALSEREGDAAFAAQAATPEDIEAWRKGAITQLESALDIMAGRNGATPPDDPLARRMAQDREKIIEAMRQAPIAGTDALKTRVHGDFHLGQILWADGDVYIIDFEGEPARPIDSRRIKSSPLRDVAGLLRSISYAAAFAARQDDGDDAVPNEATLEALRRDAEEAFSKAYSEAVASDVFTGASGKEVSLLNLFLVEKAAYEVCYEAANRPEWIAIPSRGLARVLAAFPGLEKLADDA